MFAMFGLGFGEIIVLAIIGVIMVVPAIIFIPKLSQGAKDQQNTLQRLRDEIDDLRVENDRLREENERLRHAGAPPTAAPADTGIKPPDA